MQSNGISLAESSARLVKAELDARLFSSSTSFIEQKAQISKLQARLQQATSNKLPNNIIFSIKTKLSTAQRRYNHQLDARRYWDSYNTMYDFCDECVEIANKLVTNC